MRTRAGRAGADNSILLLVHTYARCCSAQEDAVGQMILAFRVGTRQFESTHTFVSQCSSRATPVPSVIDRICSYFHRYSYRGFNWRQSLKQFYSLLIPLLLLCFCYHTGFFLFMSFIEDDPWVQFTQRCLLLVAVQRYWE